MEKEIWANARTEDQKLIQAIVALSEITTLHNTINLGDVGFQTIQTLALAGGSFELDLFIGPTLTLIIKVGKLRIYALAHMTAATYEKQKIAFGFSNTFRFGVGKRFTLIDNAYLVP